MFNIIFCRWLDLNLGPLESESTAEPQQLPLPALLLWEKYLSKIARKTVRKDWKENVVMTQSRLRTLNIIWWCILNARWVRKSFKQCFQSVRMSSDQCDQMARFVVEFLAIYNNENLHSGKYFFCRSRFKILNQWSNVFAKVFKFLSHMVTLIPDLNNLLCISSSA